MRLWKKSGNLSVALLRAVFQKSVKKRTKNEKKGTLENDFSRVNLAVFVVL